MNKGRTFQSEKIKVISLISRSTLIIILERKEDKNNFEG